MVKLGRGSDVLLRRTPGRVGHVIIFRVAKERRPASAAVRPAEPASKWLAGAPWPDLLAAAHQLLERERMGPGARQGDDGVPEVRTSHRQHQIRSS